MARARENRESQWGYGEPTQDGDVGFGHQPAQANAGYRCGGGEKAAGPDEVFGLIVDKGEASGTAAVMLCGRLGQPRKEVSITVCASLLVLECVVKRGEVLEQPLDSRAVVPKVSDIFQSHVIRETRKCDRSYLKGSLNSA